MSLKLLKTAGRLRKKIGVQLALWYSGIFILSSLALAAFAFFHLSPSLRRIEKDFTQMRLKEYVALYEGGGLERVLREIQTDGKRDDVFVRIAGPDNKTLFISQSPEWSGYDLDSLGHSSNAALPDEWIRLQKRNDEDIFELKAARLPDGGYMHVGKTSASGNDLLERFENTFVGVAATVVVFGLLGGALVGFRALAPVHSLIRTVESVVKTGRMDARVPVRQTGDELDELGSLFNAMLEKIEILIRGMRDCLDNVAHDLRTPLTRLRGTAETAMQATGDDGACREALADCLEESDQILTMLRSLMDISEAETGAMKLLLKTVEVPGIVDDVLGLYRYVAEEKRIVVSTRLPDSLPIIADRSRVRQVLSNLLDNAIKYTPEGGRVEVEAYGCSTHAVVVIRDTGIGIPEDEIPKIWERLYRGDKSRSQQGLGLGLSLVKAIVGAHGGYVTATSRPGAGACFSLFLPVNPVPKISS